MRARLRFVPMTAAFAVSFAASAGSEVMNGGDASTRASPPTLCFARAYDAGHLARHPKQQVSEIGIIVAYKANDPEHPFPYTLLARVRGHDGVLRNSGDCGFRDVDGLEVNLPGGEALRSNAEMRCSADRNLGEIVVQPIGNGGKALLKLESLRRVMLRGTCDDDSCGYDLRPSAEDKTFLLDRALGRACAKMENANQ